jgi:hypothetical protein
MELIVYDITQSIVCELVQLPAHETAVIENFVADVAKKVRLLGFSRSDTDRIIADAQKRVKERRQIDRFSAEIAAIRQKYDDELLVERFKSLRM